MLHGFIPASPALCRFSQRQLISIDFESCAEAAARFPGNHPQSVDPGTASIQSPIGIPGGSREAIPLPNEGRGARLKTT